MGLITDDQEVLKQGFRDLKDSQRETFVGLLEDLHQGIEDFELGTALEELGELGRDVFLDLEDQAVKSAKAFPDKLVEGFEERLGEIDTTFQIIKTFGGDTARDLNKSFNSFFNKGFKTGTFEMGNLWKNVLDNMKNNFINTLSDMAARSGSLSADLSADLSARVSGLSLAGLSVRCSALSGFIRGRCKPGRCLNPFANQSIVSTRRLP